MTPAAKPAPGPVTVTEIWAPLSAGNFRAGVRYFQLPAPGIGTPFLYHWNVYGPSPSTRAWKRALPPWATVRLPRGEANSGVMLANTRTASASICWR